MLLSENAPIVIQQVACFDSLSYSQKMSRITLCEEVMLLRCVLLSTSFTLLKHHEFYERATVKCAYAGTHDRSDNLSERRHLYTHAHAHIHRRTRTRTHTQREFSRAVVGYRYAISCCADNHAFFPPSSSLSSPPRRSPAPHFCSARASWPRWFTALR